MIAITVPPVDVIHAGPLFNNRQMSSCNYYITMYHSCQQDSENLFNYFVYLVFGRMVMAGAFTFVIITALSGLGRLAGIL